MTSTQQTAVTALMTLFPPHPLGYGKLSGYKNGDKNQWTEKAQASEAEYLWHLTSKQNVPHGIGQYAKQGDLAFWLCFDMDQHKAGFEEAATLVYEALEGRGFTPYWETTTSGGIHVWAFPPPGGISCEALVQVGKVIIAEVHRAQETAPIEIYPASFETGAVYGGKYANLPYRGALLDPAELGATYLMWEGTAIPLSELGEIDRTPLEVWERAAKDYEAPPRYDGPTSTDPAPNVWAAVKAAVEKWKPSQRHETFLAVSGAGFRTGTAPEEIKAFLKACSPSWFGGDEKGRNTDAEIDRAVESTYQKGATGLPIAGIPTLRHMGCNIPKFKPPEPQITFIKGSEKRMLDEIKEEVKKLPSDPEEALETALGMSLWTRVASLSKAEQGVIIHALKRRLGITTTDAKNYIKEAAQKEELSPNDLRDLVLEVWNTAGLHVRYIAEWEDWYIYEAGTYRRALAEAMKKRVEEVLEAQGHKLRESVLSDVVAKVSRSRKVFIERGPKPPPFLNLKNGLLDVDTLELRPHNPNVFSTAQADAVYDENAACPGFAGFISRVCPDPDNRATLQEFAGYVLSKDNNLQKVLYLKGGGGTGKGTFVSIIRALLKGEDNHGLATTMGLSQIEDDNHSLVSAVGKKLIYVSEVPAKASLEGVKKISGEDPMLINPKNKATYNVKLEAKIIITANTNIFVGEDNANNSIDRRFIILPFDIPQRPQDRDPEIVAKLTSPEELSGVLLWCLYGWQRLRANSFRFTSDGDAAQRMEFLENSNPVITFLRDVAIADLEAETKSSDLFEAWKEWCLGKDVLITTGTFDRFSNEVTRWKRVGGSGHMVGSQKSFTEKVGAAVKVLEWTVTKETTRTGKFWQGLRLINDGSVTDA